MDAKVGGAAGGVNVSGWRRLGKHHARRFHAPWRATKRTASLPAALMLVSVIVAATTDGKRYQQAARDGDPDDAREQQREHDAPECRSHVRPSLCYLTRAPPGVFTPETVQRLVPGSLSS
jgi:hypothetical protein